MYITHTFSMVHVYRDQYTPGYVATYAVLMELYICIYTLYGGCIFNILVHCGEYSRRNPPKITDEARLEVTYN